MAFLGAEAIMDEIETVLKAGYSAAVTTVNSAYPDGVAIAAPASANYRRVFDPADQNELDTYEYPLVVIRPEPEDVIDDAALGDEYGITTPIEVSVIEGYDDEATQKKRLLRHMRVVKTILGPHAALAVGEIRYAGGGFARTWTTDSGVVRDVSMLFPVTVYERP